MNSSADVFPQLYSGGHLLVPPGSHADLCSDKLFSAVAISEDFSMAKKST